MIPYGRQDITQADLDAVRDVLLSDYLTQGPVVPRFEGEIATRARVSHAIAVNSATSALHIACMALDLGPGDWLWTSPISFVASANCGRYCGARVDLVDIDPRSYNISPSALESKLKTAKDEGRLPKIVVPVHLSGQSADMRAIHSLGLEYGFKIIEDASHAIGGTYLGDPIGTCQFSDITVFSFHPVKIITTAEGGMALTNSDEIAASLRLFRSHGITRDPAHMTHPPDGDWYYQQIALGYNYRMTELQAALGLSQLERLEVYVERRHHLAHRYDEALSDLPLSRPWRDPNSRSAFHLYVIRLHLSQIKKSHREVFDSLRSLGIGVNVHYIPIHTQPYYRAQRSISGKFPEAERYYAEAISLPMYSALTDDQQDKVISVLRDVLGS